MHDKVSSNGTPSATPRRIDVGLAQLRIGGVHVQGVRESQRQRPSHRRSEFRRRIGKWVVTERAEHDAIDAGSGAVYASLREQDDVAARKVDVFVRRVVARRRALDRPVRGCVDVAHVDRQRDEIAVRGRQSRRSGAGRRRSSVRPAPTRDPRRRKSAAPRLASLRRRVARRCRDHRTGEQPSSFGH